ncbi:MAG: hypothetical protein ACJ8AW_22190 [Rhodopila sp.]
MLNDVAFSYMHSRALPAFLIARLAEHGATLFADQTAWSAHLDGLGLSTLTTTPDPVLIATEGAVWGSVAAHSFLQRAVVLSDDAGQFAIATHALCWVHAERLVHKLEAFTDQHRAAQQRVRGLIWDYYADLKAYRADPNPRRRLSLRARFDRIFRRRTGFATLDRLLARLWANKAELLRVLDRPEVPLHTNAPRTTSAARSQAQGQRRDAQRPRPRLPRCLPRPGQDLRQAGHCVLGLPRQPVGRSGCRSHSATARVGPISRATSLTLLTARGLPVLPSWPFGIPELEAGILRRRAAWIWTALYTGSGRQDDRPWHCDS